MAAFPLCSAPVSVDGMKPIEEIHKGDWVWSVAPETGDPELKQVEDVFVNETDEIVHVRYGDTEIDATPTHPFYTPDRGWVSAVNLRAGDRLQLLNGEYVVVEQVQHEILESPVKVYNFEVQDNHTYYVGGDDDDSAILVHNACEKVLPSTGSFERARNKALDLTKDMGYKSKPYRGKLGVGKGKIVGRQSLDGKLRWRVDFDHQKGPHINVEDFRSGKGFHAQKYVIPFNGTEKTVESLLKHLGR